MSCSSEAVGLCQHSNACPLLLGLLGCGDNDVQVEDLTALPKKANGHEEKEKHCPSPAGTPVADTTWFLHPLPTASQKFIATIPCQSLLLQPHLNRAWEPLHQLHLAPRVDAKAGHHNVNFLFHQNKAKLSPRKRTKYPWYPTKRISAATKTCTFQRNSFRAGGNIKHKSLWLRRET